MEIIVAGYNIDHEVLQILKEKSPQAVITPETISAAYARISRDPRPINELRKEALEEVEKARKSNRHIVFTMGHSSIAEHACFNIDILGVSRLITEEIERSRLASYTEKSQRYVLLKSDFVIPFEIKGTSLETEYVAAVERLYRFYERLYRQLLPYILEKYNTLAKDPAKRPLLEGWAKEDARYILPLSMKTQIGMTINARALERMLRRLAASSLMEGRLFSQKLYEATYPIAPSLIRYTEPTPYERQTSVELKQEVIKALSTEDDDSSPTLSEDVVLSYVTPEADERLIAALLYSSSSLPFARCLEKARTMDKETKEKIIKSTFRHIKSYDVVRREFEYTDLCFDLTVSASCFAQLKRHRMATITCQDYDPILDVTIPPNVLAVDMEETFREETAAVEKIYYKLKRAVGPAATYILTNAHRRRVHLKVNTRELYHIARLRADQSAQWDIRHLAKRMLDLARREMPLTLLLATGKEEFETLKQNLFPSESTNTLP